MAGEPHMAAGALLVLCACAACASAQEQAPVSRPGWPCVAGRAIDPTYVRTAEATGGQVFLFDRSEAGRSMALMQYTDKHDDTILRSTGTLSTGSHEFIFPVDSTVESLLITVTLQCLQSITVLRPTNTEVHAGEPDVNDNRFRSGQVLILTRPQAGAWRVRIAGIGLFFVVAQAKSSISLDRAEFVEPGGRPGHEGLFPVKEPLSMGLQTLLLKVTAPPGEMKVRLINSEGNTLEAIEMERISETDAEHEFVRTFDVKHPAFRLVVEGQDTGGYPYQRVLPRLFQAQVPNVIE